MIKWNVHEDCLKTQVKQLPEWHRVIYAALCGERALPAYETYAAHARNRKRAFSEFASLQSAIEFVWAGIETAAFDRRELDNHLKAVNALVDKQEDAPAPSSLWQTHALDVAYVIMYAVRTLLFRDADGVIGAATSLNNTVFYFAQDKLERPSKVTVPHQRIESDPTVQGELERQQSDILVLLSHKDADPRILFRDLRIKAKNEKALPI